MERRGLVQNFLSPSSGLVRVRKISSLCKMADKEEKGKGNVDVSEQTSLPRGQWRLDSPACLPDCLTDTARTTAGDPLFPAKKLPSFKM